MAAPTIVGWLWTFGDGTTSTERTPTHEYKMPGTYTVSLTIEDSNGFSYRIIKYDYIIVTDWDMIGGLNVSKTDVCLRFAVPQEPSQGRGWSLYDDVNNGVATGDWPYPEGVVGTENYSDENGREHHLVMDSNSFRIFEVGREEQWIDGEGDYAGSEIESEITWREHMPPVGATAKLGHMQSRVDVKPWFKDQRSTGQYDANGFRGGFEMDVYVKTDSSPDQFAITKAVPFKGQLVYDRHVQSEFLQMGAKLRGAPWRLTRAQQFFKQQDTAAAPPEKLMSEYSWAEEWGESFLWVSRYADDALMNLSTGVAFAGASNVATGPDNRARSAIALTAGVTQATTAPMTGDFTLSMWVRNPADGLVLFQFSNPELRLILDDMADGWRLRWDDDDSTPDFFLSTEFPDWAMITVRRSGDNVAVFENGALVSTNRLNNGNIQYAGNMVIGNGVVSLFDIRGVARGVSDNATAYMYDDVIQNSGNAICPPF